MVLMVYYGWKMADDLDNGRITLSKRIDRSKYRLTFVFAVLFLLVNFHIASQSVSIMNQLSTAANGFVALTDDVEAREPDDDTTMDAPMLLLLGKRRMGKGVVWDNNNDKNDNNKKRPSIVLFGDSLTQRAFGENGHAGWASLLAATYSRRADVTNRGFGGYNTRHALHVWPTVEQAYEESNHNTVLFSTLFFGANDAVLPGNPQHVPLKEYRENLIQLIHKIRGKLHQQDSSNNQQDQPSKPILVLTPPPVDEEAWSAFRNHTESNRINAVTRSYGKMVREAVHQILLQQEQQQLQQSSSCPPLAVLDTWELLQGHNQTAYSQYLSDGLHLNELGNRKIYQGVMELIERDYPHLAPKTVKDADEGVPLEGLPWQDVPITTIVDYNSSNSNNDQPQESTS
ncbi:Isoamyl acetate-hydrolyzing esterase 1 homolog [Seminavis robusta]|uniref:Isoamyl acetate-hydrolyzing esterase 1 homolog n=1 Tax=Seminavis robusta TaxID=568900 RepID=A0A9N8DPU4_9STRA|nr:Isoamyl acetate-hydrolyzing esterase 1 homolog [Seminavis robusta]|eukprot:Sro261_g101840.1 Isoamyl acetate-hydrolyzing esterase 1 homolog (400) ;mRNA; r:66366-67565